VAAIENVHAAIEQIAQTTMRTFVGRHTLDETLSETDRINPGTRKILDVATVEWGVGHPGRTQGHPAARQHEACGGQAGRG
jgi:regulator of protease activity HflC (stomatin/prohibitin superfamily)